MNNAAITVRDFFGLQEIKLSDEQISGIERQQITQRVFDAVSGLSSLTRRDVAGVVAESIGETLKIGLPDLLAATWCKSRELRKFLDREKYKPEDVNYVELVKHSVSSDHEPEVELLLNDSPMGKLRFKVTLELEVDGAVLKIQDARIRELRAIACKGICKVKYGEYELLEKESEEIKFPGVVDLGEGFAIPS